MNLPMIDVDMLPTSQQRSLLDVEQARAVQQVQAQLMVAKRFPRDSMAAYTRIMKEFERPSLAKSALYTYPRGGQTVTGPSIRMAEVLARNYGNLEYGIREIERRDGKSICEAYCWDVETNVRFPRQFEVAHKRDTKQGAKDLTDERDIYELIANMGARRMRACILSIIPADFVEDAVDRVRKVLALGDKSEPLHDRIKRILLAFKELGVTQEMIEKRLGHAAAEIIADEIVELQGIYNALKDKTAKREDFFEIKKTTDELVASIAAANAPVEKEGKNVRN